MSALPLECVEVAGEGAFATWRRLKTEGSGVPVILGNDIVDQGTGTLSGLAAALLADDWWYFWWD